MISNIPIPQSDQTLESIFANICLYNARKTNASSISVIFGKPSINIKSPVTRGISNLFNVTGGMGYLTEECFVDNHCYFPIYKFRINEDEYGHQRSLMLLDRKVFMHNAVQDPIISNEINFCPKCIQDDLALINFSYARRSHQFVGVQVCHTHSAPLQTLDKSNSNRFAGCGLLIPEFKNEKKSWVLNLVEANALTAISHSYAALVNATLLGNIETSGLGLKFLTKLKTLDVEQRTPSLFLNRESLKERFRPLLNENFFNCPFESMESLIKKIISSSIRSLNPLTGLNLASYLFSDHLDLNIQPMPVY